MVQSRQKREQVFGGNSCTLDSQCFQIFLDKLAEEYPDNLTVVQLDNGKFHHSYQLKIISGYFTDFLTARSVPN